MIKLEKLSKKYGTNYAIKDVSMQVDAFEAVAVVGPSGGGKSTLLRCINHLEEPTSGQVSINGEKVTKKNRHLAALKIGMVFQNFNLFPNMDVKGNLIYSPKVVLGMKRHEVEHKAKELLTQFGLENKLHAKISSLSGGQKQRIAIARSLMMNPEIMLFDEPTSALDPEVIKDLIQIISLLKSKMTIIVVSHHLKFAKAVADRIVFMDKGLVLADQKVDQFFSKPKSQRARLFLENIGDLM